MATNHDRRLSRLEEHHLSERPRMHWLKGETQADINAQVKNLVASRRAKETDLFVHWQL
jgi:hypothetical protein